VGSPGVMDRRAKAFVGLLFLTIAGPMCGGGGGSGGSGGGGGGGTFSVVSHAPVQGASNIARTATLYVVVNGTVDPTTLTSATITLTGAGVIPATRTWNPITSSIEIRPQSPFMDSGALLTLSLGSGVMTTGGASLVPLSFTFNTVSSSDTTLPTFGGITSITGVGTNSVTLNWSTPGSDDTTLVGSLLYDVYVSTASGSQNYGQPPTTTSLAGAASVVVALPTSDLTYYFVVLCRDAAGNLSSTLVELSQKTLVSFSSDIYTPIVHNICTMCHVSGGIAQFMDLSISASDTVLNKWVGQPANTGAGPPQMCQASGLIRVVAGSPSTSLVYLKISQTTPPCGVRMPEGLAPLSTAQIQLFFDWITQGANNN